MENFCYGLSACIKLVLPAAAAIWWYRKKGGSLYAAMIGFFVYFAVSVLRFPIRDALPDSGEAFAAFLKAALTAVLEESARFAAFAYILRNNDKYEDAVSYGIGHSALEIICDGMRTFGMIGLYEGDKPIYGLIWLIRDAAVNSTALCFHCAMSVLILWGIKTERIKRVLPAAIITHMMINFIGSFMPAVGVIIFGCISSAALVFAAVKLTNRDKYYF